MHPSWWPTWQYALGAIHGILTLLCAMAAAIIGGGWDEDE